MSRSSLEGRFVDDVSRRRRRPGRRTLTLSLSLSLSLWCWTASWIPTTSAFAVAGRVRRRWTTTIRASPAADAAPKRSPKRTSDTRTTASSKRTTASERASTRAIAVAALTPPKRRRGADFSVRRLERNPAYAALEDERDRSFARLLVATVERRSGQIDVVLRRSASVYPPKKGRHSELLRACLRVGAAQLLFLDTPPYAALKETVQVLREQPYPIPEPMVKFANAVLRSVSRHGRETLANSTSTSDNVAPRLWEEWRRDWGDDAARRSAEHAASEPFVDLSLRRDRLDDAEVEDLRRRLGGDATLLINGVTLRAAGVGGDPRSWPRYDDGVWWVQDASSTTPATVLASALDDLPRRRVVDACSAPGGKCAGLLAAGVGRVTAVEVDARRGRRLTENLRRLGWDDERRCDVVVARGQDWVPDDDVVVDGALLDVPCTATGTGARRPEVLRKDVDEALSSDGGGLLDTQEALANHYADVVLRKHGILVYSTCSLLKRESEHQIHKLLSRNDNKMETLPIRPSEVPGFENFIDKHGWLRILPGTQEGHFNSCDGFFVARLVKVRD